MKNVFFLVNTSDEFDFAGVAEELLPGVQVETGDVLPSRLEEYSLVVLWSIRKLLPEVVGRKNVVLFHSSDLPRGRGWAPIYNTIVNREEFFTVTGIIPQKDADTGDIVIRARFAMRPEYTADFLRRTDDRISLMLVAKLLKKFSGGPLRGIPQQGTGTYYPRRNPGGNEVPLEKPLGEVVDHVRACESAHPAFFRYKGVKYTISIVPERAPDFPGDLTIEFPVDTV